MAIKLSIVNNTAGFDDVYETEVCGTIMGDDYSLDPGSAVRRDGEIVCNFLYISLLSMYFDFFVNK